MWWPLCSVCWLLLSLQMQLYITDVPVYGAHKFYPRYSQQDIHALSGSVPGNAVYMMSGDIAGVSPKLSSGKPLEGGVQDGGDLVGDGGKGKEVEEAGDDIGTISWDNPRIEFQTIPAYEPDEGVRPMAGGGIFDMGGSVIKGLLNKVGLFGQEEDEEEEGEEEVEGGGKKSGKRKGLLGGLLSRFI